MTEISNLITLGVIIGVAILALKTGLGCGFANLGRREIAYVALILFHYLYRTRLSGRCYPSECNAKYTCNGCYNAPYHRNRLVYFGIKTKREWLSHGNDLSRRTFLWLSVPCPVCLTATFLACLMLSRLTRISNLRIGFWWA